MRIGKAGTGVAIVAAFVLLCAGQAYGHQVKGNPTPSCANVKFQLEGFQTHGLYHFTLTANNQTQHQDKTGPISVTFDWPSLTKTVADVNYHLSWTGAEQGSSANYTFHSKGCNPPPTTTSTTSTTIHNTTTTTGHHDTTTTAPTTTVPQTSTTAHHNTTTSVVTPDCGSGSDGTLLAAPAVCSEPNFPG